MTSRTSRATNVSNIEVVKNVKHTKLLTRRTSWGSLCATVFCELCMYAEARALSFSVLELRATRTQRKRRKPGHSVSLFTGQECPKISMTSNPRQNCRIGQPFTKKWFFSPDQLGLRRKRKGKSGEIRSLPETLGSTL